MEHDWDSFYEECYRVSYAKNGDTEILTDGVSTSAPNFSQETSEVAATASSPIISLFVFISIRF